MPRTPVTILIPARLGSTRFPGKVLADKTGKPLIQHVVEGASRSAVASRVIVATDDPRVLEAVRRFGGEAVMTGEHPNGTSRLAEAAKTLALPADSIVVNVQGDEPELESSLIDAAVNALTDGTPDSQSLAGRATLGRADMSTVAVPFLPTEDARDPNLVKVVLRLDGTALYFSRALIPFARDAGGRPVMPLKHIGLYVYRRPFLDTYVSLPPTDLERTEQLEQLRVLAHGYPITVALGEPRLHAGIDTPEQYEAFVARHVGRRG